MKRRNFLKGLVATPFAIKAIVEAKPADTPKEFIPVNKNNFTKSTEYDLTEQLIKYIQYNRPSFKYEKVRTPAFIADNGKSYVVRATKLKTWVKVKEIHHTGVNRYTLKSIVDELEATHPKQKIYIYQAFLSSVIYNFEMQKGVIVRYVTT
jgi:hypothetical protein